MNWKKIHPKKVPSREDTPRVCPWSYLEQIPYTHLFKTNGINECGAISEWYFFSDIHIYIFIYKLYTFYVYIRPWHFIDTYVTYVYKWNVYVYELSYIVEQVQCRSKSAQLSRAPECFDASTAVYQLRYTPGILTVCHNGKIINILRQIKNGNNKAV